MSYQLKVPQHRRVAARFVGKVRRSLQRALVQNPEVSRSDIARELEVHRSVITRQFQGTADISLGRVAEIASVLGYRPQFSLEKIESRDGSNLSAEAVYASVAAKLPPSIRVITSVSTEPVVLTGKMIEEREPV